MNNNTIFDDVFRTMVEKMPELVIPLINEVFGTHYPLNTKYNQMRNEHQLPDGEIITDSCLRIGNCYYHIECQSTDDKTMAIRMVEYDFHIALEHAERNGHDYVMEFPKSCVLYIRYGKNIPDRLSVKVIFPDNSTHTYQIPTVRTYEYDKEEIMKKSLFFLLPYYILRYENALSKIEKSEKRMETLSAEYKEIESDLCKFLQDKNPGLLVDLMKIIKNVADYVLRDHQSTRKELDQIMGGKVLELESERLYKKGNSEGQKQILQLMQKITPEDDIKKLYSGNKEYINELLKKYNIK